MKGIHRKTYKEVCAEERQAYKKIVVGGEDCRYWFVACDTCNVAYFEGETILSKGNGRWKCRNIVPKYFNFYGEKVCDGSLSGGDEDCFNRYYRLI